MKFFEVLFLQFFLCMNIAVCAEPAGGVDEVIIKDGSVLKGTISKMTDGALVITTKYAGDVSVKWSEISSVKTKEAKDFLLSDGTNLKGSSAPFKPGVVKISSSNLGAPAEIKLGSVSAINPPKVKAITYKGNINAGANASDGNTRTKSASLLAGFEARSKRQRLTLGAATNYSQDSDGNILTRNSRGDIKYDFFFTKRLYGFTSAFFEGDKFQDLNLRTALSTGPGYQIIDKGDFTNEYFSGLQWYAEAGVSYFNEDFKIAEDQSYVSGRWSMKVDLPILTDKLSLFHNHVGYPSFDTIKDLYIITEQGIRFEILKNFNATFQVNWRYDSTPSPGFKRGDTLYLMTLGYNFDL